ncbi:MAG: hypothetical protein JWM16_296 [Verrucomicrobiales bacterium]|nr:hypothetical protein [Verrucomicrobiales bacterium]
MWCEDISGDELLLLWLSGIVGFLGVGKWTKVNFLKMPGGRRAFRPILNGALVFGFACLYLSLRSWSDPVVRDSPCYITILMAWSVAGLTVSSLAFPYLGISLRFDCVAGNNLSAAYSLGGALLGLMLIHCGSNIGRGPSLWNNVFSAVAGTFVWLALWLMVEYSTRVSLAVTEERDAASGLRLGSFLCAEGLILGRAVAGDWESMSSTIVDLLRDGWFGLGLAVMAIVFEKRLQPRRGNPFPNWLKNGLSPGAAYLACSGLVLVLLGKWKTHS